MNSLQDTFGTLSQALGWALLHSVWQGLLLFGLLYIILKLVPRASAKLRYRLSALALGGVAMWFVYTAASYWQSLQRYTVTISTQADTITWQQSVKQDPSFIGAQVTRWLAPVEDYLPVLVGIYLAGVLALLLRLVYNIAGIRSLTAKDISAPADEWLEILRNCMQQLGMTRNVRLLFSTRITVPMITGTLKPVILIPVATITRLDTYQAEAILLHELAHIRRYDYLINIVQIIIETLLFFNPFVWAISSIIRREREHCCDDIVMEHTASPLSYAHALTTLETYRQNPLAMAATGSNNQLFHRIKRMMEMNRNTISYGPLFTVSLAVLLAVSFVWLTPVLAQSKKDKAVTTAAPGPDSSKVVKKERVTIVDPSGNKRTYNSMADVPDEDRKKLDDADGGNKKVIVKKIVTDRNGKEEVDINKTIQEAMDGVDWTQISKDISSAMVEVNTALSEIDWESIAADTKAAMEESKKAMEEAKKEMEKIDWSKIDAETQKAMHESKKAMLEAERAMRESEKALRALPPVPPAPPVRAAPVVPVAGNTSYDRMLARMDADGLIDRGSKYKIEKKDDALYIDGIKQTDATYRKYSRYLNGESVTIKGNKGTLDIRVRN